MGALRRNGGRTSKALVFVVLTLGALVDSGPVGADANINGSIGASDPTLVNRLFRNGAAATCATPKTYPGTVFGDTRHYDSYAFTATPGTCVTVTLETTAGSDNLGLQAVAYSPSFNPADISQNYLADPGATPFVGSVSVSFSFVTPPSGTFVLVVYEVTPNTPGSYNLQVMGANLAPADVTAPSCFVSALIAGPPKQMQVTVQDTGSGLAGITNVQIVNGTVSTSPSPIPPGTTSPVVVTATKVDQSQSTVWSFDAVDVAGNIRHCA